MLAIVTFYLYREPIICVRCAKVLALYEPPTILQLRY